MSLKDHTNDHRWTRAANLGLLILIWLDFFFVFSREWDFNEQYRFGYLVPFIALYLAYLRWLDRPEAKPLQGKGWLAIPITLGALAYLPLKVILEANPDWRMALWTDGFLVLGITLLIVLRWGGWSWLRHFIFPPFLMLLTIPWPTRLENPFIQGLMQLVAHVTVEILNLLGIHAVQLGNLIQLTNGLVGVEEACSGVRSFQSILMASVFLGELFRFRLFLRIALILFGNLLAIVFNLARTFVLTFVIVQHGPKVMAHWHDSVGYLVTIAAFLVLLGSALLISKGKQGEGASVAQTQAPKGSRYGPHWMPFGFSLAAAVIMMLSIPVSSLWFTLKSSGLDNRRVTEIDWSRAAPVVKFEKISGTIRALLRYSEGVKALWSDRTGESWLVYFFYWDEGNISSFAGIHNPEICMPASGFELVDQADPIVWHDPGSEINLKSYQFRARSIPIYVFFGVWDDNAEGFIPVAHTGVDRLKNALDGLRVTGRRSLQIIITGVESLEESKGEGKAIHGLRRPH